MLFMKNDLPKHIFDFIHSDHLDKCTFLNDPQKKILKLREIEHKTFTEIALILCKSSARIGFIYKLSRRKLHLKLDPIYEYHPQYMEIDKFKTPLCLLPLCIRTVNALQKHGEIKTLGDLVGYSATKLLNIPDIGLKSLCEIQKLLEIHEKTLIFTYQKITSIKDQDYKKNL